MTDMNAIERAKLAINPPNIIGIVNGKTFTDNDISARVFRFLEDYGLDLQEAIGHGFVEDRQGWHWLTDAGVNFHRENVLVTLPDMAGMSSQPTRAMHVSGFDFVDVPESLIDILMALDFSIEDAIHQRLVKLVHGRDGWVTGELRLTDVLPLAQKMLREERGL